MADDPSATGTATEAERDDAPADEQPGAALAITEEARPAPTAAPLPMLPGEVRPHPTPQRYVVIAAVLVAVTAAEVGLYYLQGDVADGLIIGFLLTFAFIKFTLVASWYMHLRTDKPIFRRFFVLGIVAAIALYLIVLTMLHVFSR
jgi:cytochrome c oxidase subunit 4